MFFTCLVNVSNNSVAPQVYCPLLFQKLIIFTYIMDLNKSNGFKWYSAPAVTASFPDLRNSAQGQKACQTSCPIINLVQ